MHPLRGALAILTLTYLMMDNYSLPGSVSQERETEVELGNGRRYPVVYGPLSKSPDSPAAANEGASLLQALVSSSRL